MRGAEFPRDAACATGIVWANGDPFFPSDGKYHQAEAICAQCPVLTKCALDALATEARLIRNRGWSSNPISGYVGGMTPDERIKLLEESSMVAGLPADSALNVSLREFVEANGNYALDWNDCDEHPWDSATADAEPVLEDCA